MRPTLIHRGERTHHQLQSITWQSFSTIKAIVRRPLNPIPLFETFVFSSLIFLFFKCYYYFFFILFCGQESIWRDSLRLLYSKKLLVDSLNLKTVFYQRYYFYRDFPKNFFKSFFSTFQRYYNISKIQNIFRSFFNNQNHQSLFDTAYLVYIDCVQISLQFCPTHDVLHYHNNVFY